MQLLFSPCSIQYFLEGSHYGQSTLKGSKIKLHLLASSIYKSFEILLCEICVSFSLFYFIHSFIYVDVDSCIFICLHYGKQILFFTKLKRVNRDILICTQD